MTDSTLVLYDRARVALAQASNLDEVKDVLDKAEALRLYTKQIGESQECQNTWGEIKLRAMRRAGELLVEMADVGRRPLGRPEKESPPVTLSEMGISKMESSRWQTIARMPEEAFEHEIATVKQEGGDLTRTAMIQAAKRLVRPEWVVTPEMPIGQYNTIVIDPPWPMQKIEREERPNQGLALDYPIMSLEEIEALPIPTLMAPDGCHVYLWVTQKYLPAGLDLFRAWGVTYQCLLTWVKPTGMTPYSWMYNTEHVIYGHVGNLKLERLGLKLSFDAPVVRHSQKPDVFYERVLQASPGPRLEMFSRQPRDGFTAWGAEV